MKQEDNLLFANMKNCESQFKLIDAQKLKIWFSDKARQAQGIFPELISKLIKESFVSIKDMRFPNNEMIYLDGWDGYLHNEYDTRFVAKGESVWELGATTSNSIEKLRSDYKKRTSQTSKAEREKLTFYLVTPIALQSSQMTKLNKEFSQGGWKEVKIYDAIQLEEWLSNCINTSLWLYEQFENKKLDITYFDKAFDTFMSRTNPKMVQELFTASRDKQVNEFLSSVVKDTKTLITGPSRIEVYGFILSAIHSNLKSIEVERVIVCNSYNSFKQLDSNVRDKIIICNFIIEESDLSTKNHYVYIVDKKYVDTARKSENIITLLDRPSSLIEEILAKDMGVPRNIIANSQHRFRNNIMLILHTLASESYLNLGQWMDEESLIKLIPLMLVGKVDIKNKKDLEVLQHFLPENDSVEDYINSIRPLYKVDNSPLFCYGDQVKVSIKEEVWISVKDNISSKMVSRLIKLVEDIFDRKQDETNSLLGNCLEYYPGGYKYSKNIICGLLDSCILLAIYNDEQENIDLLVKKIFDNIRNERDFCSLSVYFPLIAECAPNVFLECIDNIIANKTFIIDYLFGKKGESNFFTNNYCHLLFALEGLMCINDVKIGVCRTLISLMEMDYNYRMTNSPQDTLINNLHWVNKYNAFSFDDKVNIVNKLIIPKGKKFFSIPLSLINWQKFIMVSTHLLSWRNVDLNSEEITNDMVFDASRSFVNAMLKEITNKDTDIIKKILDLYRYFTIDTLNDIKSFIKQKYTKDTYESRLLYEYFVEKRCWVVKSTNTDTTHNMLDLIEDLIDYLKPTDMLESCLVYFRGNGYNNLFVEAIDGNFNIEQSNRNKIMCKLLDNLYQKYDHKLLFEKIIANLQSYSSWYSIKIKLPLSSDDISCIVEILKREKRYGLLVSFLEDINPDYINKVIEQENSELVLEMLPFIAQYPQIPNGIDTNLSYEKIYYANRGMYNDIPKEEREKIKQYNPKYFLRWMCYKDDIEPLEIDEIIEVIANLPIEDYQDCDDLVTLFDRLDKLTTDERVAQLEIKYLSVNNIYADMFNGVSRYYYENPGELLNILTTGGDEQKSGHLAFQLGVQYQLPKNFDEDIDKLYRFISLFMQFEDKNKEVSLKHFLGGVLARTFNLAHTNDLPELLMGILEKCQDENVNIGVVAGYTNSMGARIVTDGNDLKQLAEKYRQKVNEIEISYPQSAKILRYLANDRERVAKKDKEFSLTCDDLL